MAFRSALVNEMRPVVKGGRKSGEEMVGVQRGTDTTNVEAVGGGRAPERERGAKRGDEGAVAVGERNA